MLLRGKCRRAPRLGSLFNSPQVFQAPLRLGVGGGVSTQWPAYPRERRPRRPRTAARLRSSRPTTARAT
eukprot:scaffold80708_cov75-Phaeocystis_antarctica.AAC.1